MNAAYIKYPGPTRTITKSTKIKKEVIEALNKPSIFMVYLAKLK